jgi:hypothetical protein
MERHGGRVRLEWNVIMNSDIEDLLREGMERFTRDVRAPAGLLERAARRRHRRLAVRSVAGVAAALTAAAVVLAAVVVPGSGPGVGVALAAHMVKQVDSALTAADPGEIAQVTITTRGEAPGLAGKNATATAEEWSYGDQWRSVTYARSGKPVYDEGFSTAKVYTLVSYPSRAWARQRGLGLPGPLGSPFGLSPSLGLGGPLGVSHPFAGRSAPKPISRRCGPVFALGAMLFQPGLPGVGFSATSPPATVARTLRAAISCGTLAVAGRQRIDGIEATKLTSAPGSPIAETIWVNPRTYLPARVVVRSSAGYSGPVDLTANITWLRPTAQNLANLTVPVPAGFRKVALADVIGLTLLKGPGGPSGGSVTICYSAPADCPHKGQPANGGS